MNEQHTLTVRGLSKSFQRGATPAVNDVSFSLEAGSIVALLGPSGCGKTTTLRLIAGFERPDAGSVELEGKTLFSVAGMTGSGATGSGTTGSGTTGSGTTGSNTDCSPEARGIGFVFQDYALFPHLSVLENVTFGLDRLSRPERLERANEVLGLVGLTIFRDRLPSQLSGGQQQRVALARALAPRPKLILLDEPFSSLDANLRASTRLEIQKILKSINATALLVTHDQEEAMSFSDRLIVMRAGRIEQDGPPEQVYQAPRTAFVASFLGRTNLINGQAGRGSVQTVLGLVGHELVRPEPTGNDSGIYSGNDSGPVMLSIRPESLRLHPNEAGTGALGTVTAREYHGHSISYNVEVGGLHLTVLGDPTRPVKVGESCRVTLEGPAVLVGSSSR
jgi:iron(III) transport system ATP-binding protein